MIDRKQLAAMIKDHLLSGRAPSQAMAWTREDWDAIIDALTATPALEHDLGRAIANHAADLSAAPEEAPLVELGELVLIPDGMGTIVAEWNDERHTMPPGTKLYGRVPMNSGEASK